MPLTEQLSQVNPIQGRNISPGTDNSLASGLSGLAGLAGAISSASARGRANRMEEARLELAQNQDERAQERHDLEMAEARREQQFIEVENEYRSQRRRLQSALEAGAVSEEGYDLQLRNLINRTHARNPGYAEELDTLVTALGDTGVAFTQSEMIAAQEQAEIAGQAQIREGLNQAALTYGLADMPNGNGERDSAVMSLVQADQQARSTMLAIQAQAAVRQEDTAQAQADRANQIQQYQTNVNQYFNAQVGADVHALTLRSRTAEAGDLETQQGLREDSDILIASVEDHRFRLLQEAGGDPNLEQAINEAADARIAEVTELFDVYGERGARLASDFQANFANELGQIPAIAALNMANELDLDPETLMVHGGGEMVSVAIGEISDAQNRLFTLQNGGPMPVDDPEEYRDVAVEAVGMTSRTADYINNSPTQSREAADQFTAGVVGQVRYTESMSTEGGATFQGMRGFSESLTNPGTVSAVRNLMADPETAQHGQAVAVALRSGLMDLLAVERGRIDQDGNLRLATAAGGAGTVRGASVRINPETGYMEVTRAAGALATGGPISPGGATLADRRRLQEAQQYAQNYNNIVDTLVETGEWESPALAAIPVDEARVLYGQMSAEQVVSRALSYQEQLELANAERTQSIIDMAQQGQLNPDGSTSPTPVSGRGDRSTGVPPGEARDAGTQQSVLPGQGTSKASAVSRSMPAGENAADRSLNLDPFLDDLAQVESSGNPNARSSSSSAAGLFQFTEETWEDMTDRFGLEQYEDPDFRFDEEASREVVRRMTESNFEMLRERLGRDPSDGELYSAHFLGRTGSRRLMTALEENPEQLASDVFPRAARSNPNVFTNGLTVEGLIDWMEEKFAD